MIFAFYITVFLGGCGRNKAELVLTKENNESEIQQESRPDPSETILSPTEAVTPTPAHIYVDVCGAVSAPGVYELPVGSRVFQAVEAAGGMLAEASKASVNQAQLLSDGVQIYIPSTEEVQSGITAGPGGDATITQDTEEGASAADGTVNINTADLTGFMTLPGIGESKAQAILSYREENGSFSSIEEIMQVPGIKEGTYSKIKDKLSVG